MAFYTIEFAVTAQGVTPVTPQAAGHTGDHKAALVRFTVPFEGYRYRLEIADGGGGYDITDLLEADDGVVSYEIPSAWTAAGVATLRLIAVEQDEAKAEIVRFHSAPAYLRFEDREEGEPLGESLRPAWQETLDEAHFFLETMEQKLTNGDFRGEKGDRGEAGPPGEKGEKGDKGDPGDGNMALMCQTFAGALTDRVTGPCVALTDVSPLPHNTIVQVRPHNHVQFPYLYETQTVNNVTVYAYTQPESGIEGEVVLYTDGAAEADASFVFSKAYLTAGTYYLNAHFSEGITGVWLQLTAIDGSVVYGACKAYDEAAVRVPTDGEYGLTLFVAAGTEIDPATESDYLFAYPTLSDTPGIEHEVYRSVAPAFGADNLFSMNEWDYSSYISYRSGVFNVTAPALIALQELVPAAQMAAHFSGDATFEAGTYRFTCNDLTDLSAQTYKMWLRIVLEDGTSDVLVSGEETDVGQPFSVHSITTADSGFAILEAGFSYQTTFCLQRKTAPVTVKLFGKNLIDPAKIMYGKELMGTSIQDNSLWYITGWIPVMPSTTYTVSGTSSLRRLEADTQGTVLNQNFSGSTFTTTKKTRYVLFNSLIEEYDKPQLEVGNVETVYEPYAEPIEYVPNADGTLTIPSRSPSMTLRSDTAGVAIAATYNKDTNKVIGGLLERISALEAAAVNNA